MQLDESPTTSVGNANRPFSSMQPELSAHDATTMRPLQPAWAMQTDLSPSMQPDLSAHMQLDESLATSMGNADGPF